MGWGSAVAGAAISAAGNIASSAMNNSNARKMASTSVQTRVKDLRAAGLNPVLAATHGSLQAAQVPQQQAPDLSPIARVFDQMTGRMNANSARQQADNNTRQTDASTALMGAQSAKTLADTKVALGQAEVQKSQQHLLDEQALTQSALRSNYAAQTGLASANAVRTQYQTTQDKVLSDYYKTDLGRNSLQDAADSKAPRGFDLLNIVHRHLNNDVVPGIKNRFSDYSHSAKAVGKTVKGALNRTITIPKVNYNPNDIKRPY